VWRVELCKTRKQYAMKEMSKARYFNTLNENLIKKVCPFSY